MSKFVEHLADFLIAHRRSLLALFTGITLVLGYFALQLHADAAFNKMIPLQHQYMRTFTHYQKTFGGANRVVIALIQKSGAGQDDIFNPTFFKTLKQVTDEVFFIPGVDRPSVTSLFTPNVRFIEIVEEGFTGGNVIPADFKGTPQDLERVRANLLKSWELGRLVSADFTGALVRAELLEVDPITGKKLDYRAIAQRLEDLRSRYQTRDISLHIIGFAKAVGDITDGAIGVIAFFAVAFLITCILLYLYSNSLKLTALALACALTPVLWLLGLLTVLGYGIDPMSILVPFLIFAIGVSHAVQMTNAWKLEWLASKDPVAASRQAFIKLFIPGAVALLTNALGFMVIMLIKIDIVRELGITASIGVALMIITNKFMLPILLSYTRLSSRESARAQAQLGRLDGLWRWLTRFAQPRPAAVTLGVAALLLVLGAWKAQDLRIGDLGSGIPELRETARYNRDSAVITHKFAIGVDVLGVVAQSQPGACTEYAVMDVLDRFEWRMRNVDGIQSVMGIAGLAKIIHSGWNEGNPKWRALPRNRQVLAQAVMPIDTSTGLLNPNCDAMQILIFTQDHQGETIAHIVQEVKRFAREHDSDKVKFLLATGNVGVMAATNEAVDAAETEMLAAIFASIVLLCWLTFRSWRAVLCITLPLALISVLCNALMASLGIGLKVSTLPVVALGVGVGVDYGIYLYDRIQHYLNQGMNLPQAYGEGLKQRGTAVMFTAATMSIGVGSWAFSALKFQADMGLLLAFMFLVNALGAVLLLPALAAWLSRLGTPRASNKGKM